MVNLKTNHGNSGSIKASEIKPVREKAGAPFQSKPAGKRKQAKKRSGAKIDEKAAGAKAIYFAPFSIETVPASDSRVTTPSGD